MRKVLGLEGGLQDRFTEVYLQNMWQDPESRSGPGSRRDSPCVTSTIDTLEMVVERFGVRSIADIPCGDFNWMGEFLDRRPEIAYTGFDIVKPLVAANRERHPRHQFHVLDVTAKAPPRVDLILCKDLLNHLSNADVRKALANFVASGSQLLLASNNFGLPNTEIPSHKGGASRLLDITLPPFDYPAPIWNHHYLGLWRLSDFPQAG